MPLTPSPEREIHLRDYLWMLRRHQWLMLAIFAVTVVTTTIWTFLQTPVYEAAARLVIDPEAPRVINIQDVSPIGGLNLDYYQTQYELIRSRPVMERTIDALKLDQQLSALAGAKDPVAMLQRMVIVEPKRNTRLVSVKFDDPNPALAAEIANTVAQQYARYNLDTKLRAAKEALAWLTDQTSTLKKKVEDSATALQNYRVKSGILGIQEQRQITAQKIMDFNKAYLDAQAQRLAIEAKLSQLKAIAKEKSGAQTIFIVADSPLIQKLKAEAADLDVQRSKLLRIYKEKHPEVQKVEAQIQQVNQKIDVELANMIRAVETEYRVAQAREATLLGNVQALTHEGQNLNEKEIQYGVFQREAESNQQMYDAVLKRVKETGVEGGLESNNIRIVEEATVPKTPVRPRKRFNIIVSALVGLTVSLGVAFLLEYLDNTIKTPDEVERYLGLPTLAVVPMFAGRR